MNKKLKLALAALLGFSAACSSVKNSPVKGDPNPAPGTVVSKGDTIYPRVIAMYGVRFPKDIKHTQLPDSLAPVVEQPQDDSLTNPTVRK